MNIIKLGLMDYEKALSIQERLLALRQQDKISDTLLIIEHPPVLTVGRSGSYDNILASKQFFADNGIAVYDVSRGGDVTYHGPGQIVGYPIMDLKNRGSDVHQFVVNIQETIIRLLQTEYGVPACREHKKYTGVWVGDEKITAIGISVKRGVTMHGFAFNVNTDLSHYGWINPCGITDKGVTSLQKVLGKPLDFDRVADLVVRYFCEVFDETPEPKQLSELIREDDHATQA